MDGWKYVIAHLNIIANIRLNDEKRLTQFVCERATASLAQRIQRFLVHTLLYKSAPHRTNDGEDQIASAQKVISEDFSLSVSYRWNLRSDCIEHRHAAHCTCAAQTTLPRRHCSTPSVAAQHSKAMFAVKHQLRGWYTVGAARPQLVLARGVVAGCSTQFEAMQMLCFVQKNIYLRRTGVQNYPLIQQFHLLSHVLRQNMHLFDACTDIHPAHV
jgi:hypothetical protein